MVKVEKITENGLYRALGNVLKGRPLRIPIEEVSGVFLRSPVSIEQSVSITFKNGFAIELYARGKASELGNALDKARKIEEVFDELVATLLHRM